MGNTSIVELHDLLKKDCEVINDHLIEYYDFDDINHYKYYNPNLIRDHGSVKNDQLLHLDFPKRLYACTTMSNTTSHSNLPVKKRKNYEKDNNLTVIKRKPSIRKKSKYLINQKNIKQ